jgi:hypothetical protein
VHPAGVSFEHALGRRDFRHARHFLGRLGHGIDRWSRCAVAVDSL